SPSPTALYILSLHDALPISVSFAGFGGRRLVFERDDQRRLTGIASPISRLNIDRQILFGIFEQAVHRPRDFGAAIRAGRRDKQLDRKSTRLNSSHVSISYAV